MAQIKSQKKRILTNEKAHVANAAQRSALRTSMKKVRKAVEEKNLEVAVALLSKAISLIDKSVSDGLQHQNKKKKKKASLSKLVDSIR